MDRFPPNLQNLIAKYLAIENARKVSKMIIKEIPGGCRIYHNFVPRPTRKCCICWEIPEGTVVYNCAQTWTIRYMCLSCVERYYNGDRIEAACDMGSRRGYGPGDCTFGDPEKDPYINRSEFVKCPRCRHYCHPRILVDDGCRQSVCLGGTDGRLVAYI